MSRPARPLAAATATRLRDVAAEAFARDGLDAASLNGILRRAEIGKGSFYHYFPDKAALHDWVTESLSEALLAELRPPSLDALTASSFQPALSELLGQLAHIAVAQPELMNLGRMFHNSAEVAVERKVASLRRTVIAWVTDALRTGQSLKVVRADLPLDLLSQWTITSLTVLDQWALTANTSVATRRKVTQTALSDIWRMVTPQSQSAR